MKYIVYEDYSGLEIPILFPDIVDHRDIATKMGINGIMHTDLKSAGFCTVTSCNKVLPGQYGPTEFIKVSTYGKSVTLNLSSREKDGDLISRAFEV